MALTFQFYSDAALTTPLASLGFTQAADNSLAPETKSAYFGSTTATRTLKAQSNPGVDPINLSVLDANTATGEPATAVKMALAEADLATATAGAAISLGTQVLSGTANAVRVWIQVDDATAAVGTYTDLSLQTVACVES